MESDFEYHAKCGCRVLLVAKTDFATSRTMPSMKCDHHFKRSPYRVRNLNMLVREARQAFRQSRSVERILANMRLFRGD